MMHDDWAGAPLWGFLDDNEGDVEELALQVTLMLGDQGSITTAIDTPDFLSEEIEQFDLVNKIRIKRAALRVMAESTVDLSNELARLTALAIELGMVDGDPPDEGDDEE